MPMEMNDIELPQETSFRLLSLTFTRSMEWKPYIQSIAKAASRKVDSYYRAQHFLTPEIYLNLYKPIIRLCVEYCCHMWGDAHGLDLLNRVQKRFASPVTHE